MNNKEFFKMLNKPSAIIIAMVSGICTYFFAYKLIPVFHEVTSLIDNGTLIDTKGVVTIALLCMLGVFTYFLGLYFQLAQKRVVELFGM